ncbi:hypothetical protein, partial [Plesiomonas shigelloides]|uniref:hypothetical protein n=1 Tax=Plesiomonas shigelloides TaxID=703 RepID=UPI001C49BB11
HTTLIFSSVNPPYRRVFLCLFCLRVGEKVISVFFLRKQLTREFESDKGAERTFRQGSII